MGTERGTKRFEAPWCKDNKNHGNNKITKTCGGSTIG